MPDLLLERIQAGPSTHGPLSAPPHAASGRQAQRCPISSSSVSVQAIGGWRNVGKVDHAFHFTTTSIAAGRTYSVAIRIDPFSPPSTRGLASAAPDDFIMAQPLTCEPLLPASQHGQDGLKCRATRERPGCATPSQPPRGLPWHRPALYGPLSKAPRPRP